MKSALCALAILASSLVYAMLAWEPELAANQPVVITASAETNDPEQLQEELIRELMGPQRISAGGYNYGSCEGAIHAVLLDPEPCAQIWSVEDILSEEPISCEIKANVITWLKNRISELKRNDTETSRKLLPALEQGLRDANEFPCGDISCSSVSNLSCACDFNAEPAACERACGGWYSCE